MIAVQTVNIDPAPDVQSLGDAAVIRGAAAVDVYRVLAEGIRIVRVRDGITPPMHLLQAAAALKLSAEVAQRRRASDTSDTSDVRRSPNWRSLRNELIGTTEVARMTGLSNRQAQRLVGTIGGRKVRGRLVVPRELVETHIAEEGRKSA